MKKILEKLMMISLIIMLIISICPKKYAKMNPTLNDIVNIFNSCNIVKMYNQNTDDIDMIASSNNNEGTLTVQVTENGNVTYINYKLEQNILSGKYSEGNTKEREYWVEVTNILIDCIEQCHGYAEGEMFDTLKSNEIANYTLEDHGLIITNKSGNLFWVQVDITKPIPTVDTNSYIKVTDLDELKDNLTGDGIAKLKKGKALFYKYTVDNKEMLIIGEQEKFSYIINKSIQSILQVMFESEKVVEYYKENYTAVQDNKQFEGFKIEVNPIKNDIEESVFGADDTYQFVRIAIEKEAVKNAIKAKDEENKNETQSESSSPGTDIDTKASATTETTTNIKKTELPNTGSFLECLQNILFATAGITTIGLIVFVIKTKEN